MHCRLGLTLSTSDCRPRALSSEKCSAARCLLSAGRRGRFTEIWPSQRKIHDGLEIAELVARVVARSVDLICEDLPLLQEPAESVRQLNFSRPITRGVAQRREDVGRQKVAADDRQIRRCVLAPRFFDEILDRVDPVAESDGGIDLDDAVVRDLVVRHALDGEHRASDLLEYLNHLLQRRRRRVDDIIGQDDGEWLVANEICGTSTAWPRPSGSPCRTYATLIMFEIVDLLQEIELAALLEKTFELDVDVEMILDRVFTAAGDDDDVVDAGQHCLFDPVLDDRLVDQREHFLWLRFSGGQKSGAETGSREDNFANARFHAPILPELPVTTYSLR